jgi:hypothetical protein
MGQGDILNQLALISDLLEKINLEATNKKITLDVASSEFERIKAIIEDKINIKTIIKNTISINIGEIIIVINKI